MSLDTSNDASVIYRAVIVNELPPHGDCDQPFMTSTSLILNYLLWRHAALACSAPGIRSLLILKVPRKPPRAVREIQGDQGAQWIQKFQKVQEVQRVDASGQVGIHVGEKRMSFLGIYGSLNGFREFYGPEPSEVDRLMPKRGKEEKDKYVAILLQERCYSEQSLSDKDLILVCFNLLVYSKEEIEASILYNVSPLVRGPIILPLPTLTTISVILTCAIFFSSFLGSNTTHQKRGFF